MSAEAEVELKAAVAEPPKEQEVTFEMSSSSSSRRGLFAALGPNTAVETFTGAEGRSGLFCGSSVFVSVVVKVVWTPAKEKQREYSKQKSETFDKEIPH